MPILVLAGEEDFQLSRRVDELKEELLDPAWLAFNLARLDCPDLTAVIDAAATLPFGPGKRLVIFERCDLFTKKRPRAGTDAVKGSDRASPQGDKAQRELLEAFDSALSAVAPDTCLLFACPYNFDSTLRTAKIVAKYAQIEDFPREKYFAGSHNPRLETWCQKEARRHGATIDDQAVTFLLDSTEADLRQISMEIEKAATFLLPERHITLAVVSKLSAHHSHVFSLLDSWASGDRHKALSSLEELTSRQSGIPIIATLHSTLTRWIAVKALAARTLAALPSGPGVQRRQLPLHDLARKLAPELNAKPFVVEKDLERTRCFGLEKLVAKQVQLCQLESLVKTGQMPDHHALTLFFTT